MTGLLALIGGQEHQRGCEAFDLRLLREAGVSRPEVTVLLAATTPRRRAFKKAEATTYWERLGARARIGFTGRPDDAEHALELLQQPDLVVLTGGRPWLLQARLSTALLRDRLRALWRSGVPISGSSAGAMALAQWRWAFEPFGPLAVAPGLNFVPGVLVAPHYGRHGTDHWAERTRRRHPHLTVLGLQDRSALVGRDGDWQALGTGWVLLLRDRVRRRYRDGAAVLLPTPGTIAGPRAAGAARTAAAARTAGAHVLVVGAPGAATRPLTAGPRNSPAAGPGPWPATAPSPASGTAAPG